MRAGLSTIQQTLTPEAATVLTHSIAEAARRNHGQTTPLHVAATLLSSPNGLLRQACIKSHPNSSHPLQCRALELCFSVALDRLPSNPNPNPPPPPAQISDPPLSNALMAALKRAQAHQRRGCPEQQQSPLLAVKVELDQLVVSILDDPSVSRVMKEASFSSPAVKATIEHSLSSTPPLPTPSSTSSLASPAASGLGYGFGSRSSTLRNLYMNPRLQHQQQQQQQKENLVAGSGGARGGERKDEVTRVMDVLMRSKKRNPILVGDSDVSPVTKEVIQRLEKRELGDKVRTVISLASELEGIERAQIPAKIRELGSLIEAKVLAPGSDAVVIDLGDLKWLVESNGGLGPKLGQQQQQASSDIARVAVAEMARNFRRFSEILVAGGGRVWALGTASCATYLRCQVYHPTMETEWDLYVVPVAAKAPTSGLFSSLGSNNGILSSSVEALAPPKGFPSIKPPNLSPTLSRPPETSATAAAASQKQALCPQCTESYESELAKLMAEEFDKSSSASRTDQEKSNLPQWLQIATPSITKDHQSKSKEHELNCKQSMEDLLKRWKLTCSRLHSKSITLNPRLCQPKLVNPSLPQGFPPTLPLSSSSNRPAGRPGSPVKTDLVLGNTKPPVVSSPLEKAHFERIRGFPGCKQDNSTAATAVLANFEDSDSLKRLFKGLLDKVSWQPDAASAITSAVLQSKSGNGKRRGVMPKADTWLLFAGHDKVGKKKMASALSELVFGVEPVTVCLGSPKTTEGDGGESNMSFRGRTALDRVAEAVKQNPFSVIVLEDVDQADVVARGTIRRAIERGRLPDSYGREVSLGSAIFVLTANWLPDELKCLTDSLLAEEKLLNSANSSWHLELSVGGKRLPDWLAKEDGQSKRRKDSNSSVLSLDLNLNLAIGGNLDDEAGEGSRNSSDLTVEHEHDHGRLAIKQSTFSASEFVEPVDSMVIFQPVDFGVLRRRVSESIAGKFAAVIGSDQSVRVDDNVLDRIVGGIWLSGVGFDDWAERVLVPNIERLKGNSMVDGGASVQLRAVDSGQSKLKRVSVAGDWLPDTVTLAGI